MSASLNMAELPPIRDAEDQIGDGQLSGGGEEQWRRTKTEAELHQ